MKFLVIAKIMCQLNGTPFGNMMIFDQNPKIMYHSVLGSYSSEEEAKVARVSARTAGCFILYKDVVEVKETCQNLERKGYDCRHPKDAPW